MMIIELLLLLCVVCRVSGRVLSPKGQSQTESGGPDEECW